MAAKFGATPVGAAEVKVNHAGATGFGQAPRPHWLRILFVLPFIAMLWVLLYNRLTPELFGFPFYYWYQLAWVIVSAAIAGIVYKAEH